MKNYTIVIPTMWYSNIINELLIDCVNSKLITQIILIDNNPNLKKNIPISNKINYLTKNKNLYVNPSWNLGIESASNENIIISNDDVSIKNIDLVLSEISKKDYDLIGFDIHNSNKNKTINFTEFNESSKRPNGFGTFFVVKKDKFIKIPDGIKIWYGDDIQFYGIKNKSMFNVPSVVFEMSKTVKSNPEFKTVIDTMDRPNYRLFLSNNPQ
jgi:hypothetical protein